jgi:hypothetical protein
MMPPKFKSKYKGKATQTKSESQKSQKSQNLTKLFASTISSAKQIKSWYESVIEYEKVDRSLQVQNWVEFLSNSSELLMAL